MLQPLDLMYMDPHKSQVLHSDVNFTASETKLPTVVFRQRWESLLQYAHIMNPTLLDSVWSDLYTMGTEEFQKTMEGACQATDWHLGLAFLIIMHVISKMVKDMQFEMRDCGTFIAVPITFLFFAWRVNSSRIQKSKD